MFVMTVFICLSLFRFTVVIITFSLYRNWNKNKLKKKKKKKKKAGEVPQKNPRSGSNADAEIKVPLLRTEL